MRRCVRRVTVTEGDGNPTAPGAAASTSGTAVVAGDPGIALAVALATDHKKGLLQPAPADSGS